MIPNIQSICFFLCCAGLSLHAQAQDLDPLPAKKKSSSACPSKANTGNKLSQVSRPAPAKSPLASTATASPESSFKRVRRTIIIPGRLARLTAYWPKEGGDYYTRRSLSATGVHLHNGHCAVDPHIIPYGSLVKIQGVGEYLAVDTGSAVISRRAARMIGATPAERGALVIDLFFDNAGEAQDFIEHGPKFASVTWSKPTAVAAADTVPGHALATE